MMHATRIHRWRCAGALIAVLVLVGIACPAGATDGAPIECHEVPSVVAFNGMEIVPAHPRVGDDVELQFDVTLQVFGVGAVSLHQAAPLLQGNTVLTGTLHFPLVAVRSGTTTVTLDITYHTEELCGDPSSGYYQYGPDHTVSSPAYTVEIAAPIPLPFACIGDCDGNGHVDVGDLIKAVNVALGITDVSACLPGDGNASGMITVNELIAAVDKALFGCPGELESGHCYEQVGCAPLPFDTQTSRGGCCRLARSLVGLPFSWCPAAAIDLSTGLCTQCVVNPCDGFPTPRRVTSE